MSNIIKKINEQGEFIRASIYILSGFSMVLVGYGIGRFIGLMAF
ncbi:hypothetical protein R3O67_29385 [Bacillus cereus]